jgi:hypothetical protein
MELWEYAEQYQFTTIVGSELTLKLSARSSLLSQPNLDSLKFTIHI